MEVSEEYIPPTYRVPISQPERRLYMAIIHEALRDLSKKSQYNDAYRFLTDLHSDGPTSFKRCCAILGYNAAAIAQAVRNGVRVEMTSMRLAGYFHKVQETVPHRSKSWGIRAA